MRAHRLLWFVWFFWASWLLNSVFPGMEIIKWSGSLLAAMISALFFYLFIQRKGASMKLFRREEKIPGAGKKEAGTLLPRSRSGSASAGPAAQEKAKTTGHISQEIICRSSIVACDMQLTGSLEGVGNIVIEGRVEGNISAQQISIEESGQVKGDIRAQHIVVNGRAEGNMHADTVTLQSKGVIEGTVFTDELVIDKGGIFIGQSQKKTALSADKAKGKVKTGLIAVADSGEALAQPVSR